MVNGRRSKKNTDFSYWNFYESPMNHHEFIALFHGFGPSVRHFGSAVISISCGMTCSWCILCMSLVCTQYVFMLFSIWIHYNDSHVCKLCIHMYSNCTFKFYSKAMLQMERFKAATQWGKLNMVERRDRLLLLKVDRCTRGDNTTRVDIGLYCRCHIWL